MREKNPNDTESMYKDETVSSRIDSLINQTMEYNFFVFYSIFTSKLINLDFPSWRHGGGSLNHITKVNRRSSIAKVSINSLYY